MKNDTGSFILLPASCFLLPASFFRITNSESRKLVDFMDNLLHKQFMGTSRPIEEIRKEFHNEWLLISVDSVDTATTQPLTGELLDHASSPDPLWEKAGKLSRNKEVMVIYSDDWPDDLAACFFQW